MVTLLALAGLTLAVEAIQHSTKINLPDCYMILPGLVACLVLLRHHPATTRIVVGMSTVSVWLACVANLDTLSEKLEQQASVKPLAMRLRAAPDFQTANVFACEVRAHGWEFYLQRVSHATINEADVVLDPTPEQEARLIKSPDDCEKTMLPKGPCYGIVREDRFKKKRSFTPDKWTIIDQAGDFLLIASRDTALGGAVTDRRPAPAP